MIGLGPLFLETQSLSRFLHDTDGNLRGAFICWAIAISALVVLRVPHQVVLTCLVIATATVGLASLIVEAAPVSARATASKPLDPPASYRAIPPRSPARDQD